MTKTHIIIGASAAGLGVLNKLRALDPQSTIICISQEADPLYNKCFLADVASGSKSPESITTKPASFFSDNRIELWCGKKVTALDTAKKILQLSDGQQVAYDTLFIGTGSSPRIPSIAGLVAAQGIGTFHTRADIQDIMRHPGSRVVIIGAGLSGIECADALLARGMQVTVIERQPFVLSRQVNAPAATLIEQRMIERGVTLYKQATVQEIVTHHNTVTGVRIDDVTTTHVLPTDLLILATGLQPNTTWLHTLTMNGSFLVVDPFLQTSDPAIWAGGDCVIVHSSTTGLPVISCMWADAMQQGMYAAYGMAGQPQRYPGATLLSTAHFFGLHLSTAGVMEGKIQVHADSHFYHAMATRDGRLVGFIVLGSVQQALPFKRALGQPLSSACLCEGSQGGSDTN